MKAIQLLFLSLFLVACSSVPDKQAPEAVELPVTLEAAVDQIVSELTQEEKQKIKQTPHNKLILFHRSWGAEIRNTYRLFDGNDELRKSACGREKCHPDDASMEIIYGVWNVLNGNEYRFKPK